MNNIILYEYNTYELQIKDVKNYIDLSTIKHVFDIHDTQKIRFVSYF